MDEITEALDALAQVAEHRKEVDRLERDRIEAARKAGASWAKIATTLGIRSRQGAEQRYTRLKESLREP